MKIIAIAATDPNGAIGYQNKLLFNSKTDMQHFHRKTVGHVVLMGRKTFESIGNPLKERTNIVLSKDPDFKPQGVEVFGCLQSFLTAYKDKDVTVFIIGGAQIYEATKHLWSEIFLTNILLEFEKVDAYFPEWYSKNWDIETFDHVKENGVLLEFIHYKRF